MSFCPNWINYGPTLLALQRLALQELQEDERVGVAGLAGNPLQAWQPCSGLGLLEFLEWLGLQEGN